MRPVSIAWGGLFALVLTGTAAAAPLNPQPLPPGRHALNPQPLPPGRQATPMVFVVCANPKHGKAQAAGAHGRTGAGKAHGACASGRR
jgi:hypothetical protein